ncbi:MAG: hypothetical protein WD708_06060 [Kiritimatiellia bacterium]
MKPFDNSNPRTRYQRREQAAADALRGLVRDLLTDQFPGAADMEEEFILRLYMRVRLNAEGQLRFEPDLRSQLIGQMEEMLETTEAFRMGTVYDFHENSYDAIASRPPDAESVFAGYDPFGHPTWVSFDTVSSGIKKENESVHVIIQSGKELKSRQLAEYGKSSHAYSLLGQLCVGYLPLPAAYQKIANAPRLAVTLQVVESRNSRGGFELHLNILCGGLLIEEFETLLEEPGLHSFACKLREAEQNLSRLSKKAQQAWRHQDTQTLNSILKQIPSFLGRTTNQLQTSN